MDYIQEINIIEAVIHVLDNNSEEPVLNEFCLDLTDEVYSFLLKHLQKCFNAEELKHALYNDEDNAVRNISQKYLNGQDDLLNTSKELASEFFNLMRAHGNIPSCDFITVSISTEIGPVLGILKMDYVKNFMHKIDVIEEKIGINITPQYIGLPGSGQKLSKCAFIKPYKENQKYDLMIIDKLNKNESNEDYGAKYFIDKYLGCEIVNNERDNTRDFYNITERWTRTNLAENADRAERTRTSLKRELKDADIINIQEFTKKIFADQEETQKDYIEYLSKYGIVENLNVDKRWVAKKLKRTRIKIDSDIDIYINEDAYNDVNRFEIERAGDGSINIVLKHIKNYIEK